MDNIYLYPKVNNKSLAAPNPYIEDLENSIIKHFNIINENNLKYGVLELFQYFFRTDAFLFNWFEDVHGKRFGKIQVLFFLFFLVLKKAFKKRIIWILHNKYTPEKGKHYWTDLMYNLLMKNSDLILTHSEEGISFVKKHYESQIFKVHYIIHPINSLFPKTESKSYEYDLLIWGSIQPYKGILEFLKFINSNKDFEQIKILIIGKCSNHNYLKQIEQEFTTKVHLINKVLSLEEISVFAQKAKFIFFPYQSKTLLSSGVLIDSLRMHSKIIGPNSGAFKDLSFLSDIAVYNDFSELQKLIEKNNKFEYDFLEKERFCSENSWDSFSHKFKNIYNQKFGN